jgi:hypothetical protein
MSDQMVRPAEPFRFPLNGVGVTGSNVDLVTDPVEASETRLVTGVTIEDEDNNLDRVILLAGRMGAEKRIANSGSVSDGIPYRFTDNFYLVDGERLIIRFVGTVDDDVLTATVEGLVKYQVPPVVEME